MLDINIRHLAYPPNPKPILKGFSLRLMPGSLTCLQGSNGSGKTSILNLIAGVLSEHGKAMFEGWIRYQETDLDSVRLTEKHKYLSYVMADPDTQVFFPSVLIEMCFPLENMGIAKEAMHSRITQAVEFFDIADLLERNPATLSLGEKKLLLFAISEIMDSPVMLLDEPESGLSTATRILLDTWLQKCRKRGKLVIIASHDPLRYAADEVIDLDEYAGD